MSIIPKVFKNYAVIHDVELGHVMRKLNGITINGEYLGNSVVINGMFRAICTISPVIMRDFVQIINKIEKFEEAVKIHNFNCGFDCIDIEFGNNQSKGIASLYFKLINGDPELTNCKLVIDGREYSTFQEKITLPAPQKDMPKASTMSEEERRNKIRELKEKKLEKMRQAENLRRQKLNAAAKNIAGATPPMSKPAPMAELSEEERLKRKRQELLERKKKLIEAKKAALQGAAKGDSGATDSMNGGGVASDNSSTLADNNSELSKSESAMSKQAAGKSVANSSQISANGEAVSGNAAEAYNAENANAASQTSDTAIEGKTAKNADGTPDEYKKTQEGSSASESVDSEFSDNDIDMSDEYGDISDFEDELSGTGKKSFEDLTDEDLENLSEEELAELEAELNAELGEDNLGGMDDFGSDMDNYDGYGTSQGFDRGFAESLSQGLAQGLSEGLTQGLTGLVQGLSQLGFGGGMGNQNYGGGGFNDGSTNFGSAASQASSGYNFSDTNASVTPAQYGQLPPDYSRIDDLNSEAAMAAHDSYSYDENINMDDLSDLYSDFYEEKPDIELNEQQQIQMRQATDPTTSEVDALKAELEALKAEAETKKELMSLDEFLAKQRELEEVKEKKRRQKLRIVGSRERVNASALDGGVFVSGNKVYKWGDPKVLDQ